MLACLCDSMLSSGITSRSGNRFTLFLKPKSACFLQKWLAKLKEMCEAKFPPVSHLEEDFPVLAHMDFSEMELPGQFQQLEFSPESCVFVVRLGTRVSLIRRHGVSMRRIELICSDGRTRYFTVAATQAHNLSSTDQRMMSVYRSAHAPAALTHHCERRRDFAKHTMTVVVTLMNSRRRIM